MLWPCHIAPIIIIRMAMVFAYMMLWNLMLNCELIKWWQEFDIDSLINRPVWCMQPFYIILCEWFIKFHG